MHAMKAYGAVKLHAHSFVTSVRSWRFVVNFTPRLLYGRQKCIWW